MNLQPKKIQLEEVKFLFTNKVYWQLYGLPILSIVLCIVLLFFVVIPKASSLPRLKKKLDRLETKRETLIDKVQLVASLNEEENEKFRRLVDLALPQSKDISLILFSLNSPARREGFLVEELEFNLGELKAKAESSEDFSQLHSTSKKQTKAKSKTLKKFEEMSVKMAVSGPKTRLIDLVSGFENSLPLMRIVELDVRKDKLGAKIDMKLSMFFAQEVTLPQLEKISLNQLVLSSEEKQLLDELEQFYRRDLELFGGEEKEESIMPRDNPFAL